MRQGNRAPWSAEAVLTERDERGDLHRLAMFHAIRCSRDRTPHRTYYDS